MKIAKETDQRVRLMGEILAGMKVIKMYCWENYFGNIIKATRVFVYFMNIFINIYVIYT